MEIIVNSLLELVDENGILTYNKATEIIFEELGIDSLSQKEINDESQITCFEKAFYVKKTSNLEGIFYLKIAYDIQFSSMEKGIEIIQHGFIPFYINGFNELSISPHEPLDFILKAKYNNPDLDGFEKVEIRKRKLVCHYTKREIAIEKILSDRKLRFSELINSNDPWEYKKNIGISIEEIEDIFPAYRQNAQIFQLVDKVKSISFTMDDKEKKCFENILMWAHYGENHRGICLIFDEYKLCELFENDESFVNRRLKEKEVSYVNSAEKINSNKKDDDAITFLKKYEKPLFYTKNEAWSYESEYRLMLFPDNNEPGDTFLNGIDKALVAIILGMEYPEEYKINIHELMRNYYPYARLFQMHWDTDGYFRIKDFSGLPQNCNEILIDYLIEI